MLLSAITAWHSRSIISVDGEFSILSFTKTIKFDVNFNKEFH